MKQADHPVGALRRFLSRIPAAVFLVAGLAALLHMVPTWNAEWHTAPGWRFTGNLGDYADFMQYRVWFRQSQTEGPIVTDTFSVEANQPHIPVLFYAAVGKLARWTHRAPEFIYTDVGALFAILFVLLLFATVRHFLKSDYQAWWVFLILLLGGGLGAYFKFLASFASIQRNSLTQRLFIEPLGYTPLFEDYRGHYIFLTLFDSHFLLVWITATAAVLSLYFTLRRFSVPRAILTGLLYAGMTLLHVYEGMLLITITIAVGLLLWRKKLLNRQGWWSMAAGVIPAVICFLWLAHLTHVSGLPVPPWRAPSVFLSFLLIAYPVAWVLIAWGLAGYWRTAGLEEIFLLGWAFAGTVLTLAGPFYPYTPRGTMTLQIPIYLVAGTIYFSRHARVTKFAAVIAVLVFGATPIWGLSKLLARSRFSTNAPYMFADKGHDEVVAKLREHAKSNDILLAPEADLLWLGPEYPGKFYCAHPVWTVDYKTKREKLARFFASSEEEQVIFLQKERIHFLYAGVKQGAQRFAKIPGMVLLESAPFGSLFEYSTAGLDGSR